MNLSNTTKKQHFISRAEQSLNAKNPNANKDNKRIYSFNIVDRDSFKLSLNNESGVRIGKNSMFEDLFTFKIKENNTRLNFENLFNKYENTIKDDTRKLLTNLKKNEKIENELVRIFCTKFMNFFRNPYSIKNH